MLVRKDPQASSDYPQTVKRALRTHNAIHLDSLDFLPSSLWSLSLMMS